MEGKNVDVRRQRSESPLCKREVEQSSTSRCRPRQHCPMGHSPGSGASGGLSGLLLVVGERPSGDLRWGTGEDNDARGAGLEEGRQEIAKRARDTGATEEEAHILYHLDEVGRLFYELPGITEVDLTTSGQHVSSLVRMLASRVAEREHPEGWFFSKRDEQSI